GALPFRDVSVVHELHVLITLGGGLRCFDAEGDAFPLRIDAHHAHDHLLARLVSAGGVAARRHGDLRTRDETREARLDLHEDAGGRAVIDDAFDDSADRILLLRRLPRIADGDLAERQREAFL